MKIDSVRFIGGGRVAGIILGRLKNAGRLPSRIVVSDQNTEALGRLEAMYAKLSS